MADDNAIPVRIGHYEILKTIGASGGALPPLRCPLFEPLFLILSLPLILPLGKGNFAVVKLARHTITNLKVTIGR